MLHAWSLQQRINLKFKDGVHNITCNYWIWCNQSGILYLWWHYFVLLLIISFSCLNKWNDIYDFISCKSLNVCYACNIYSWILDVYQISWWNETRDLIFFSVFVQRTENQFSICVPQVYCFSPHIFWLGMTSKNFCNYIKA